MDAVTYIKEYKRMCEYFDSKENPARACEGCPLEWLPNGCHMIEIEDNAEKCVAAVEKWANEHPAKTRQRELLKLFPEAVLHQDGYIDICPALILNERRKPGGGCKHPQVSCCQCKRDFWSAEIECSEA